MNKYLILLFTLFTFGACSYEFPEEQDLNKPEYLGNLNAEKIIAIGDGFSGGVMDGALYTAGQKNSLAGIVAQQIGLLSGKELKMPAINSENGYNLYVEQGTQLYGKWTYRFTSNVAASPERLLSIGEAIPPFNGNKDSLQNLTIPKLKMTRLDDSSNPYYNRAFNSGNGGMMDQIVQKDPSMILCWIGMNDFLAYAMNGATDPGDLSSAETFGSAFNLLVDGIMGRTSADFVLLNLVSFDDLPFFYARPFNFIKLENKDKAAAQSAYSKFNDAVAKFNIGKPMSEWRPMISFEDNGSTLYPQPVVVIDDAMPDATWPNGEPLEKYRQLNSKEMALLSITDEMVRAGMGWKIPLSEKYYLKENHISQLKERVNGFNAIFTAAAQKYPGRIKLIDVAAVVKPISESGKYDSWGTPASNETYYEDGVPLEGGLEMNSIFSLDGVHLNQRGNAFLANQIIKKLNATYYARIPMADVNSFVGNTYDY